MELVRDKNVATYIYFPLVDADGDAVSAAGALDSEIDTWDDSTAPDGFADCTNEATEIGATGIYYLSLTQSEMNHDYIYIQVKSTNAKTQHILINTKLKEAVDTIDSNVDAILVDTGTTLDGKLDTIDGIVDAILVDTGTTLDTKITTIDTVVDAIKAVTDNLPNSGALTDLATAAALATVDTVVDAIKAVTDNLPNSGALNDLAAILTDTGTTLDTKINKLLCLGKLNLAVEFTFDGNNDNNQTDFYGYNSAANTTTNDHSTGKVVHVTGTTASFTDHKPNTTKFIDADE